MRLKPRACRGHGATATRAAGRDPYLCFDTLGKAHILLYLAQHGRSSPGIRIRLDTLEEDANAVLIAPAGAAMVLPKGWRETDRSERGAIPRLPSTTPVHCSECQQNPPKCLGKIPAFCLAVGTHHLRGTRFDVITHPPSQHTRGRVTVSRLPVCLRWHREGPPSECAVDALHVWIRILSTLHGDGGSADHRESTLLSLPVRNAGAQKVTTRRRRYAREAGQSFAFPFSYIKRHNRLKCNGLSQQKGIFAWSLVEGLQRSPCGSRLCGTLLGAVGSNRCHGRHQACHPSRGP